MDRMRIFLTGVGGQGTLTATTLLARTVMDEGLDVTSGEIHGMAQRGGVVESTILVGGWKSPKIGPGEADLLLGFERLEALRALPILKKNGIVVGNSEVLPPLSVSVGKADYPELDHVREQAEAVASTAFFLPCRTLAEKAGNRQSANTALMGAACALGLLPFGPEALERSIKKYLKPKIVDCNLKALALGAEAVPSPKNMA